MALPRRACRLAIALRSTTASDLIHATVTHVVISPQSHGDGDNGLCADHANDLAKGAGDDRDSTYDAWRRGRRKDGG